MTEIERDMMLSMVNILNEASQAYYNTGNPLMSDREFDMRLKDLQELEKETGVIFSNSPTINVGAKVLTELKEIEHSHPMLSLDKIHTVDELVRFTNNKEVVASIKLDGLTVSLTYKDGVFASAETRGNGYVGSDVTEHIKQFLNVPLKINKKDVYTIDGEAVILDNDFDEINANGEFKNSRNLISGTLNSLDTSVVSQRRARFIAWDVIEGGGSSNSLKANLYEAQELGFSVVPFWVSINLDPKKLQNTLDYIFEYASDEGYPTDGIVFKFDDIAYGKSLGKTEHHFKNGIAYKRVDDVYRTKLTDIEWGCGKSGLLTPVAIFEPVNIDGAIISRSTIHNVSILTQLDLHIGDIIEVYRANQVIPAIKRNISADERMALGKEPDYIALPPICPVCGGLTDIRQDNNSKVLICTNDNCKGKLLGKLTHFVSKNAMNVENLSESTLEKFIELGWLSSFEDIFTLKDHFTEMVKLDGFGETSVKKLFNAISASKNATLDRFIYALSIPLVGRSASKTISKYFNGDFDRFYKECCMNKFDFTILDDFGDAMNDSINDYIEKNVVMIGELSKEMNFAKPQVTSSNDNLSGLTFVITGSLNHFANRDKAKEKIESLGGKVSGSISAKTSYLVNNDITSTSGKNKKAKELNIPIISEEELIKMIG